MAGICSVSDAGLEHKLSSSSCLGGRACLTTFMGCEQEIKELLLKWQSIHIFKQGNSLNFKKYIFSIQMHLQSRTKGVRVVRFSNPTEILKIRTVKV